MTKKCRSESFCEFLEKRTSNTAQKGFYKLDLFDIEKLEESGSIIVYKNSVKDKGLVLNFCPFCGSNLIDIYKLKGLLAEDSKNEI